MNLQKFSAQFREATSTRFPFLKEGLSETLLSDYMMSPEVVEIPRAVFFKIQEVVRTFHRLTQDEKYLKHVNTHLPVSAQFPVRQSSVLMSYDFHFNADVLGLIEINTNAAGFPMMTALNDYQKTFSSWPSLTGASVSVNGDALWDDLFRSFEHAHKLWSGDRFDTLKAIVIADENVRQQRTYFEFLMYRDFFRSRGLMAEVKDSDDLTPQDLNTDGFIYNRDVDFYLNTSRLKALREAYLGERVCVSPNPRMYGLLADKERALDWSSFLSEDAGVSGIIPAMTIVTAANRASLWAARKDLFFKPVRSHGGKGAFRGSSISHKVFNSVPDNETVAQTYIEPGIHIGKHVTSEFKYDLRIYAYQDRIQGIIARVYQGQVTNFRTLGGGFAAVRFI